MAHFLGKTDRAWEVQIFKDSTANSGVQNPILEAQPQTSFFSALSIRSMPSVWTTQDLKSELLASPSTAQLHPFCFRLESAAATWFRAQSSTWNNYQLVTSPAIWPLISGVRYLICLDWVLLVWLSPSASSSIGVCWNKLQKHWHEVDVGNSRQNPHLFEQSKAKFRKHIHDSGLQIPQMWLQKTFKIQYHFPARRKEGSLFKKCNKTTRKTKLAAIRSF